MGHHPGDVGGAIPQGIPYSGGSGLSPITWMLIIAGIVIVGMIIYYFLKLKKEIKK